MPWTFAHPAAVLPLHRLTRSRGRGRFSLAALMVGSMVPDFGYYAFQFQGSAFAHSFLGSLTVCPLLGLLLLGVGGALRRPLCYMLPQPHRAALLPLALAPLRVDAMRVLMASAAVILGAWTHIVWDSFTHTDRWFVERIGWLQQHVLTVRGHELHGYSLLQYASSALGVAWLAWAYWQWLQHTAGRPQVWFERRDRWRYACIAGAALVASAIAVPWAYQEAASPEGLFGLRVFVVRWLVGTTSWFAVCFVAAALLCHWRRRLRPAGA
jgi:hypothetical protein